jgi:hypothetical protein
MKKFTLSSSMFIESNFQVNVCLKPSDLQISNYIATYVMYENEQEALIDLDRLIAEQTPLLFHVFHYSDNIPQEIRDQYEL